MAFSSEYPLRLGLVSTKNLDSKLADGEPDYRIALTDVGRQLFTAGNKLQYLSLYL